MSKATTREALRQLATRKDSDAAGLSPSTFHRWKRSNRYLTLTNAEKLATELGLRIVLIGIEDDVPSATTIPKRANPVAARVPASPPACACVQTWLRAHADLHAPPTP